MPASEPQQSEPSAGSDSSVDPPGPLARGFVADVLCVLGLLVLNPLLYLFNKSTTGTLPDGFAYLELSRELATTGDLYLRGWGHLDSGLILSPIYPFLIAMGRGFSDDGQWLGEVISSVSLLAATFLLYFLVARQANRLTAFAAVMLWQLSAPSIVFGLATLTEATFIFLLSLALLLAARYLRQPNPELLTGVLLGVSTALVFLTRHVGLTFGFALLVVLAVRGWWGGPPVLKRLSVVPLAFLAVVGAYAALLHSQTGQSVLTQHYRLGEYRVDVGEQKSTETPSEAGAYVDLIAERRRERRLTPDATEMHGMTTSVAESKPGRWARVSAVLTAPQVLLSNLAKNLEYIRASVGYVGLGLFFFTLASALLYRPERREGLFRTLLAVWLPIYVLSLSLLTGLVDRYMEVIHAFLIVQVLCEVHRLTGALPGLAPRVRYAVPLLVALVTLAFTPRLFTAVLTRPKVSDHTVLNKCRQQLGEPGAVFALHPMYAYLLGGTYRVMPNDSLARVRRYAELTGVEWMLLVDVAGSREEAKFYNRAPWVLERALELRYPDDVVPVCRVAGGIATVYKFRHGSESSD